MMGYLLGGHWEAEPEAEVSPQRKVLLGEVLTLAKAEQQFSKSKVLSLLD